MSSTLTIVSGSLAVIFGLLMAVFDHMDAKHENDQLHIQSWLNNKRKAIETNSWWTLPKTVINWMLKLKYFNVKLVSNLQACLYKQIFNIDLWIIIYGLFCISVASCLFFLWGGKAVIIFIGLLTIIFSFPFFQDSIQKSINAHLYDFFKKIIAITVTLLSLICLASILLTIQKTNIHLASLVAFTSLPASLLFTTPRVAMPQDHCIQKTIFTSLYVAIVISFFVTCLAMSIGHFVMPNLWVPQTFPMLFANVICDGFTLVATFYILEKIAKPPYLLFKIPLAIVVDLFVAALLACASLYIGLSFTPDKALSLSQVFNVLLFKAPSGTHYEFGPYFWTMHTTFIPTLFYLLIMLVSWIAKLALSIPHWVLTEVGAQDTRPLKLSKTLCGIFAAVFAALTLFATTITEPPKEKVSTSQTTSINPVFQKASKLKSSSPPLFSDLLLAPFLF